jgi:hypothetical protein
MKKEIIANHPVIMGVFTNEKYFENNSNLNAGDEEYDHIVPVFGVTAKD